MATRGRSSRKPEFAYILGRKGAFQGWSKLALGMFHVLRKREIDARREQEQDGNRTRLKIPHLHKFVVMDAVLLSTGVLARMAFPCDSGPSDLPT